MNNKDVYDKGWTDSLKQLVWWEEDEQGVGMDQNKYEWALEHRQKDPAYQPPEEKRMLSLSNETVDVVKNALLTVLEHAWDDEHRDDPPRYYTALLTLAYVELHSKFVLPEGYVDLCKIVVADPTKGKPNAYL